jgi:diguanylate cyclase
VHYQPKAALGSGKVVGVEALARWHHPAHGEIPPDEFIPVAEQAGVIRPLSRFVIRTVLEQWAAWSRRGLELEIAVNLSPWNLLDGVLADDLDALLREFGAPPRALRLEITETSMMTDPHRTAGVLKQAHALGVGLSIDDFGTGYSSLSWLSRLPVDELKIDRSFVQGVNADRSDAAIVRSTIELGRSLGLTVVAEGVEDRRTWVRLRDHGCHVAQGYLLSVPRTAEQLEIWLDDRRGQPAGSDVARIP